MQVVIVSTFDTYFDRVNLLREYYSLRGAEVLVLTSDFSHRKKTRYENERADIQLPVMAYKKNLSAHRLYSHHDFSKKVVYELENIKPDLIHALIPCNSLVKALAKYKQKTGARLIFDVNDLWPETMPIQRFKTLYPFQMWRRLRDDFIDVADQIYVECHLFQELLKKKNDEKVHTLYWSRLEEPIQCTFIEKKTFNFCYLGSINHIIDIDLIVRFLDLMNRKKKTVFHIIGNGESKENLIQRVQELGVQVIDHKEVYKQEEKQAIFDQCDYGFNVMKSSVVVGLTMKSLDYMCAGLPLINTIQGDTKTLCESRNIGWNINKETMEEVVDLIYKESAKDLVQKRINIQKVYKEYFTKDSFFHVLDETNVLGEEQ